jgi:hypothetical protein
LLSAAPAAENECDGIGVRSIVLDRFIDRHLSGDIRTAQHLENGYPQYISIHTAHPAQLPMLGKPFNNRVDGRAIANNTARQFDKKG